MIRGLAFPVGILLLSLTIFAGAFAGTVTRSHAAVGDPINLYWMTSIVANPFSDVTACIGPLGWHPDQYGWALDLMGNNPPNPANCAGVYKNDLHVRILGYNPYRSTYVHAAGFVFVEQGGVCQWVRIGVIEYSGVLRGNYRYLHTQANAHGTAFNIWVNNTLARTDVALSNFRTVGDWGCPSTTYHVHQSTVNLNGGIIWNNFNINYPLQIVAWNLFHYIHSWNYAEGY